ncbi:MAG: hypothetical protein ACK4SJ_06520 [Sphingorhabdus sp.]
MSKSRWPRKLWPLALLTRMLAGCVTSEAQADSNTELLSSGEVMLFGKWAVGCDNTRSCTAIVPLTEPSVIEPPYYLQMRYSAVFSSSDSFVIMRDGAKVTELTPEAIVVLKQGLFNENGADMVDLVENWTHFEVPRDGFADVMTVLEEWRSMPPRPIESAIPVTPLPAVRIDKPVIHPVLRGIAKRCPKGHMGSSMQAWRLVGGATLWRAACGDEGLNPTSFWAVSGPQGAPPSFLTFEDGDTQAQPFNSWFDESTGYLRMVHYFGHWQSFTDDCGIYRAYAWGEGEMKLVEKRYMPTCGTGIGPEGWIITYRAHVLDGPDSGP